MNKPIDKIGRVSSESVKKHTGKSWDQWIRILDKARARDWPHREITLFLKEKYKLSPWWQQGVAMGYEIYSGKRIEGRSAKGTFGTVATKIVPVNRKKAWEFLSSPPGLACWLEPFAPFEWRTGSAFEVEGGIVGEVRTVKKPERLRFSWRDERWPKASVVQLHLNFRPGEKCNVVIQHDQIPDEIVKNNLRDRWKRALARVHAEISGGSGNLSPKSARSK